MFKYLMALLAITTLASPALSKSAYNEVSEKALKSVYRKGKVLQAMEVCSLIFPRICYKQYSVAIPAFMEFPNCSEFVGQSTARAANSAVSSDSTSPALPVPEQIKAMIQTPIFAPCQVSSAGIILLVTTVTGKVGDLRRPEKIISLKLNDNSRRGQRLYKVQILNDEEALILPLYFIRKTR